VGNTDNIQQYRTPFGVIRQVKKYAMRHSADLCA
jgi:hypothetical protein